MVETDEVVALVVGGGQLPNFSPSYARLQLATREWQRLPLGVANRLGPFLTRYLP